MSSQEKCGLNCSYKRLYEGSQTSLTDMSSRQAVALNRVGRLRSGIVSAVRKAYPSECLQIEQQMGKRLSEADDEVLLVLLDSLFRTNTNKDLQIVVEALSTVLFDLNLIPEPSTPPRNWAGLLIANKDKKCICYSDSKVKNDKTEIQNTSTPTPDSLNNSATKSATPLDQLFNTELELGWDDVSTLPENVDSRELTPTPLIELWPDLLGNSDDTDMWSPSPVLPSGNKSPEGYEAPVLFENYVRPEIFTKKTKERKRGVPKKIPRLQAEPAVKTSENVEIKIEDITNEADEIFNALYAASSIPRPVFTRDLINIVGNESTVMKWEEECRKHPEKYKVRFIAPKSRHRSRGSLVITEEIAKIKTKKQSMSWWPDTILKYTGTRLYEIAVVLQRISDELISYKIDDNVAIIRLTTPKGLVTLVLSMTDRVEVGEEGNVALHNAYLEATQERVTLIVFLSTTGEEKDLLRLTSAVVDIANDTGIRPPCPVVAARSWEYADNRGTTSKVIL
ncbi:MAG: hypothetical protein ACKOW9_04395 [Candidatus Paceibacterota bacterium]